MEEDSNNSNSSKNNIGEDDHFTNIPLHVSEDDDDDDHDVEDLKKRISEHPLYGFLIQAHLNCLKVGIVEVEGEVGAAVNQMADAAASNELFKSNISTSSPDLDHFMEGYCMALKKLGEAIQEPVEETASFIKAMYTQLADLNANSNTSTGGPHHAFPKTP